MEPRTDALDPRLPKLLERIAVFLAVSALLMRWFFGGETSGFGINLFIHSLFWIALSAWFAGKAMSGGVSWRFTGLELPLLAFSLMCLISILQASYKLAALNHAIAYISYAILFLLAVHLLGRDLLLALLTAALFTLALYALIQRWICFPLIDETNLPEAQLIRLRSREVFSTFLYPNVFGGFLVLTLPLAAGLLLDARGRNRLTLGLRLAPLAVGIPALLFTGAAGSWIALAAGAVIFAALSATRTRGRAWIVGAGAAVAGLLVILLITTPILSSVAERSQSAKFRLAYWSAAVETSKTAPLLGVGLNNFEDHYPQHKPEFQVETSKAHNDYLQILAETGILGLAALLLLLGMGLRRSFVRGDAPPAPGAAFPTPLLIGAIGTAFLLAYLLGGIFEDIPHAGPLLAFLLFGLMAAYLLLWRHVNAVAVQGPFVFTRIGAASGLAAMMTHMAVDFDFYEMGVAMSLFLMLAFVALLANRPAEIPLSRAICYGAAALLLVAVLPAVMFLTPRALAADSEIARTRAALKTVESGRSSTEIARALADAILDSKAAMEHNPLDPEAYDLYASSEFLLWRVLRAKRVSVNMLKEKEWTLLKALDNAIRLRPDTALYAARKALFHREFFRHYQELHRNDPRAGHDLEAQDHLRNGLLLQQRAADLYPTRAMAHYDLGRMLDLDEKQEEAEQHFAEAMRLSDLAVEKRLKLGPVQYARCLKRTGRPLAAHDHLTDFLQGKFDKRDANTDSFPEDELDDLMKPMVESAINAVNKERSP